MVQYRNEEATGKPSDEFEQKPAPVRLSLQSLRQQIRFSEPERVWRQFVGGHTGDDATGMVKF